MTIFDFLDQVKLFWNRIPEQAKRLAVVTAILLGLLIAARTVLIPADFGKYGHFRAAAVEEIAAQEIHYAGQHICAECHDDVSEAKAVGFHKTVACEVCHGPAAAHTEDTEAMKLQIPRGRGYCPLCHEYLSSRPTGFPQIVSASHNPIKPCINCHEPHDPKPPETPKECSACHASIASTKAVSHHAYVPCIRCHQTPENHKLNPRTFLPSKPKTREFCGGCHATDAESEKGIPRVDMAEHEHRYVCWQCHYPHLPEAR